MCDRKKNKELRGSRSKWIVQLRNKKQYTYFVQNSFHRCYGKVSSDEAYLHKCNFEYIKKRFVSIQISSVQTRFKFGSIAF